MNRTDLVALLNAFGCPENKVDVMAEQLEKRAAQMSEGTGRTTDEALMHLLDLMRQGWAARERGF